MQLWLVGQNSMQMWDFKADAWMDGGVWEVVGIFDSEEKGVDACRDYNYFVMPLNLNQQLPHESMYIEGAYYPHEKIEVSEPPASADIS